MKTVKSTLLLLALGATALLSSCKKEDKEVDPRDAYVGTYKMDGACGNSDVNGLDLEIEKDPKSETGLIVTFELYDFFNAEEVGAEIKNGKLVFETADGEFEDQDTGEVTPVELDAEGSLSGKTLSVEVQLEGEEFCEFEGDKE